MATRITEGEVCGIRPMGGITDYNPFIITANVIVDEMASKCGKGLSETMLTQVELWLAAHLANVQDPTVGRFKFEQAEKTYQIGNRQLFGIMSDKYGQTANMLSGGCLIELDKRKFKMKSVGHTYSD